MKAFKTKETFIECRRCEYKSEPDDWYEYPSVGIDIYNYSQYNVSNDSNNVYYDEDSYFTLTLFECPGCDYKFTELPDEQNKWRCGKCLEFHDFENDAVECCT